MRLLVTRPAGDAGGLVAALEAAGHAVLADPLLEIRLLGVSPDLDGIAALLFTSTNGVHGFAAGSARRDLAAYAVGERTAAAARAVGFDSVESADGDAEALARLVAARRSPAEGGLLHACGTVTAGDLAGTLRRAGFRIRVQPVYEAVPSAGLRAATRDAIENGRLDGVLLLSPRTAGQFARLVFEAGLAERGRALHAWCLSEAVAAALAGLPLAAVHVAPAPELAALVASVGASMMEKA